MLNPVGPLGARIIAHRQAMLTPEPITDLAVRKIERDLFRAIEHGDRAAITMLQARRSFWLDRRLAN